MSFGTKDFLIAPWNLSSTKREHARTVAVADSLRMKEEFPSNCKESHRKSISV
jgi:hypothetical protein